MSPGKKTTPWSKTSGLNAIATLRGQSPRTKSARRKENGCRTWGPLSGNRIVAHIVHIAQSLTTFGRGLTARE
eukprot:5278260-Pyramimonas_sp.AAC.1